MLRSLDDFRELRQPEPLERAAPDLKVRLSVAKQKALVASLTSIVRDYQQTLTQIRRDNAYEWRYDADMMPFFGAGPWKNSSRVRSESTAVACEQHWMRLNQGITAQQPPFYGVTDDPDYDDATERVATAVWSYLDRGKWVSKARQLHKQITIVCPAMVDVQWERRTEIQPRYNWEHSEELAMGAMDAGMEPEDAWQAGLKTDSSGRVVVSADEEEVTVYEGLRLTVIPFEEIVFAPALSSEDEDLYMIGRICWYRGTDLLRMAADGELSKDAVEELLKQDGDSHNSESPELTQPFYEMAGIDASASEVTELKHTYHRYRCLRCYWRDDFKGDRRERWYVVTIHLSSDKLLGVTRNPYEHGQPSYVLFPYMEGNHTLMGTSVAERNALIQAHASAARRQLNNMTDLLLSAGFTLIADERSGLKADEVEYTLGGVIPVDSVDGIQPITIPPAVGEALSILIKLLDSLKQSSELLTSTSNPQLGAETQGNHTLGEIQIATNAGMQNFENHLAGVALRWEIVWGLCKSLIEQFAYNNQGQVPYRSPITQLSAAAATGQVSLEELKSVRLRAAALGMTADSNTKIQQAIVMNNEFKQNPLVIGAVVPGSPPNIDLLSKGLVGLIRAVKPEGWEGMVEDVSKLVDATRAMIQAAAQQQIAQVDASVGMAEEAMAEHKGTIDKLNAEELAPPAAKNGAKKSGG